ncbi:MAG: AI-2E family transporter [Sphaerochaetaceae bacterium]|nr:AI-2E family transporter [Sphaerochaetaceae bacterium]
MTTGDQKSVNTMKVCMQLLAFVAVIATFKVSSDILLPIVIAFLLYMLLIPLISQLEKAGWKSGFIVAACLAILVVCLAVLGFFAAISIQQLVNKFPTYEGKFNAVNQWFDQFIDSKFGSIESLAFLKTFEIPWYDILSSAIGRVSSDLMKIAKSLMMVILYDFFLLLESNTLANKILAFSKDSQTDLKINSFVEKINSQLGRYVSRKALICLFSGVAFYIIGEISNLDLSLACAALAMALNFIPAIGPALAVAMAGFFGLLQSFPQMDRFLAMLSQTVIAEVLIVNLVGRKTRRSYMNLSPSMILLSLLVGGYIWGVAGMFVIVPLMSLLQMILANLDSTRSIAIIMSDFRKR